MTKLDTNLDDSHIVRAVLEGDTEAFVVVYRRYNALVQSLCWDATQDVAMAQDLSQDVFLRAYSRLASLPDSERFAKWLVGVTRNVCREWRRSKSRDRHDFLGQAPDAAQPTNDMDALNDKLLQAIAGLPERDRVVIHAHYLDGENAADMAESLGLSRAGYYKQLKAALGRLARELGSKEAMLE